MGRAEVKTKLIHMSFNLYHAKMVLGAKCREKGIYWPWPQFKKLKKYNNMYKGKRCFIIATGPSLTLEDVELLEGEITFSMNSIVKWFDKTDWRPTYYFLQDISVYKALKEDIQKYNIQNMFVSSYLAYRFKIKKCNVYPLDYMNHIKDNTNFNTKFSKDCSITIYDGYTVVYSIIQMAYYMGFSEIYLLGTDCDYSGVKKHACGHGVKMDKKLESNVTDRLVYMYDYTKKVLKGENIKIINASRGGKLKVFEVVNLEDVLESEENE